MKIFIKIQGEKKGPYTLSQVETMWNNGVITADALYCTDGMKEWREITELRFSDSQKGSSKSVRTTPESSSRRHFRSKTTFVFVGLVLLAIVIGCVIYYQSRNGGTRPPEIKALEPQLDAAVAAGIERGKQILAFRQQAQDELTGQFAQSLAADKQGFLDTGVAKTLGAALGTASDAPSGLTATGARLDSLVIAWPENARPQNVHEAIDEISTYTAVYTIYCKSTYGTWEGFYQFEQTIDINTQKTLALRVLKMK